MKQVLGLVICLIAPGGLALSRKESNFFSCISQSQSLPPFDFVPPRGSNEFFSPHCQYEPALGTLLICFHDLTANQTKQDQLLHDSYGVIADYCGRLGGADLDIHTFERRYQNATKYVLSENEARAYNLSTPIRFPVRLNLTTVLTYADSFSLFAGNFAWAYDFSTIMCMFWVVTLGLIGIFNHIKHFRWNNKLKGGMIDSFRSYIALPTLNGNHFQPWNMFGALGKWAPFKLFDSLIPTTQESIVVLLYCIIVIVSSSVGYTLQDQNALLGAKDLQYYRYLADRTGILAFAQLPALFLFGGRNNILINLTGLQFNTFIIFHKWISRAMVILAALHAYAFREYTIIRGQYEKVSQETLWLFGRQALEAGILIILQAIYFFRSRWYELFLAVHIILALVFIVGAYLHCKSIGYLEWTYASMGVWALDRVWRLMKIYRFGTPKATFKLHFGTIVVSIPKPDHWKPYPGCFVYLYILSPSVSWKLWESHPFTIYSVGNEVRIYIKKKDGMTQKLYDYLLAARESQLRVAIEGPYGHASSLESYDNILLLAGGNGVPGPYYHCMHHLEQAQSKGWRKNIHFVWISPYFTALRWFGRELLALQTKDQHNYVSKDIYLTRENKLVQKTSSDTRPANSRTPLISISSEELMARVMGQLSEEHLADYHIHKMRPDVSKLISSVLDEAEVEGHRSGLAIVVCGSDILVDTIRDVVAHKVGTSGNQMRIDLFEELQVW
ncbi:hypothetical protein KL930_002517 [Ogataea haglerorum]|nr:hypothetical protein KL915_002296 [Ogataea haglerorum]KAG7709740.1 hypothetical protein KL950_001959 [Ogataea haglerorum]KAG7737740.1 hypothetical protein KL932_004043 [Ogataea haglerorum]KAG7778430.1 hypothetical protein KL930_002517 [Ogataea haglerorum]KAG7779116.1 hypothetical protein KL922_001601 [Ogataea haglerorum]